MNRIIRALVFVLPSLVAAGQSGSTAKNYVDYSNPFTSYAERTDASIPGWIKSWRGRILKRGDYDNEMDTVVYQLSRSKDGAVTAYEYVIKGWVQTSENSSYEARVYWEKYSLKKEQWEVALLIGLDTVRDYGRFSVLTKRGDGKLLVRRTGSRSMGLMSTSSLESEDDHYLTYDYYPNGQLKMVLEMKRTKSSGLVEVWDVWNIVEYYYPDGKPFKDFGDLKDGVGSYVMLDESGKVCDVCTEKLRKKAGQGVKKDE